MTRRLKQMNNQDGLTLVELLGSIVILSIIVVAFLGFFIQSARTTQVSDEILDASYIAQQQAEEIYNLTDTMNYDQLINYFHDMEKFSEEGDVYLTEIDGHRVELSIYPVEENENVIEDLYTLLIRVKDTDDKQTAQIETKLLFDEVGDEDEK